MSMICNPRNRKVSDFVATAYWREVIERAAQGIADPAIVAPFAGKHTADECRAFGNQLHCQARNDPPAKELDLKIVREFARFLKSSGGYRVSW